MRQSVGLIFDDRVSSKPGTQAHFTSTDLQTALAKFDQMAIQVVADDVKCGPGMPPELTVQIETSGNGRVWATKNKQPELDALPIPKAKTTVAPYTGDSGALPSLRYVRLRITLKAYDVPASAHVKVYVTLRDSGGEAVAPMHIKPPKKKPPKTNEEETVEVDNPHVYKNP